MPEIELTEKDLRILELEAENALLRGTIARKDVVLARISRLASMCENAMAAGRTSF